MSGNTIPNSTKSTTYRFDPNDLVIVGYDDEQKESDNVLVDERTKLKLDENMVKDIMHQGVHTPIIVRRNGQTIEVVAGRQRVLHAREANRRLEEMGRETIKVEAKLRSGEDKDLFGILISENENRRADSPMSRARKLARFLAMGGTEEEAAVRFNVTLQTITNWATLLDLAKPVQKAVDDGKLSSDAAAGLAEFTHAEQKEKLAGLLEIAESTGKKVSRRTVERETGTTQTKHTAPPKRQLLALLKMPKARLQEELGEDFIRGIRVAIGNLSVNSVGGLADLLAEADEKAKERRAKLKAAAESDAPKQRGRKKGSKNKKKAPPRAEAAE